eukprot:COSAG01_NODE_6865_length_3464_cov_50.271620_7_plen_142_part_00
MLGHSNGIKGDPDPRYLAACSLLSTTDSDSDEPATLRDLFGNSDSDDNNAPAAVPDNVSLPSLANSPPVPGHPPSPVFSAYQVRDRVAVARSLDPYISVEEHRRRQDEANVLYTQSFENQAAAYCKSLEELEAKHRREAEP